MIALMPGGLEIPSVIRGGASKGYDVEFITRETGLCIAIFYTDEAVLLLLC